MRTEAMFAYAPARAGMYESFYLRAVSPEEPVGIWIRHTVRKLPGGAPSGSLWCTVFDARLGRPFMHRVDGGEPRAGGDAWIEIAGSAIGPGRAEGRCGAARWSLRFAAGHPELRHLSPAWLYRAPLPRTKLSSPAPAASFDGVLELSGRETVVLRRWPGMVGHNWGSQHAERWIWLHGLAFADAPGAWLDLALARVRLAGKTTPWLASGALFLDGRRQRLGGLGAHAMRRIRVDAGPDRCSLELAARGGLTVQAHVEVPAESAAGWRYADPDGATHDVVNCSVAALQLTVKRSGAGAPAVRLRSAHGGAYELGVRERDHGVPIAPFPEG
jgi:hypothetical protein